MTRRLEWLRALAHVWIAELRAFKRWLEGEA
jgi:hypothetical protein